MPKPIQFFFKPQPIIKTPDIENKIIKYIANHVSVDELHSARVVNGHDIITRIPYGFSTSVSKSDNFNIMKAIYIYTSDRNNLDKLDQGFDVQLNGKSHTISARQIQNFLYIRDLDEATVLEHEAIKQRIGRRKSI